MRGDWLRLGVGFAGGHRSGWLRLALVGFTFAAVVAIAGRAPSDVQAVGEGVFQLDKTEYSTPEGTAFPVTIQRTDGGTLTVDVQVILFVDGDADLDIPAAEATKLITFPKGSNLSSQTVFIQTLNRELFEDRTIQVTILSVSNGGQIGPRSTAPVTLVGNGTPHVTDVSPDSGGTWAGEQQSLTILGDHFIVTGATVTSTIEAIEFWLPFSAAAAITVNIASGDIQVISQTMLIVRVPALTADYNASGVQASSTYDVRVQVKDSIGNFWLSPINPDDRYVYTTGPTVRQLSVQQGPPTGGTQVVVSGTKFGGAAGASCLGLVTFGGTPVTSCQYTGTDSLLATTPARFAGPAHVSVTNLAFPFPSPLVPDALYTYQGAPIITGLSPNFGPQTGGTGVTIFGSNFLLGMEQPGFTLQVLFGGNQAQFTVVNNNQINAVSPPGSGVQQVKVISSASGTSDFRTEANFTYSSGPLISSVSPANGPSVGGTIVTINGTGFVPGAVVKFGDVQAFATVMSATRIDATAPPGAGIIDISVNVNGTLSLPGAQTKYSYDGPTVTSVAPIAGPLAGGTPITIRGTNFTTASVVHVGVAVVPSVFVDPTTLTAVTPPVPAPVAAHVRVTTSSGQSPQNPADVFTYTNGPIIDIVNPDTGPTLGGTIVVIVGKNFSAPISVTFGTIPATSFNLNSATQITVLTPPTGTAGEVDVRVTKGTDVSPVGPKTKFTYVSATPKITALTPNSGSTFGGNEVTITGLGFSGATCPGSVKFGTVVAASCTLVNDSTLITMAPPNISGPTVVTVQTVNGTSEIATNYTYVSGTGPGGGTSPPAPGSGSTVTYTLSARWTLLTWTGPTGVLVSDAVRGVGVVGGTDLSARVSAVYLWDAATSTYKGYFTGADAVPGANDFTQFTQGSVYWVAILGTGSVPWVVRGP